MLRCWRVLSGLLLALSLQPAAHAGLVTGAWDPLFGSFLPNLAWQVRADAQVPNGCAIQDDGVYTTASGPCGGASFVTVKVRLFDPTLADPNDFFGVSPESGIFNLTSANLTASGVRVLGGQVVGFNSDSAFLETFSCVSPCNSPALFFSSIPSAEGNLFRFNFTAAGPQLTCVGCASNFEQRYNDQSNAAGRPDVPSGTDGLQQFLITYTSTDSSVPKYTDANGNALGARLGSTGNYLGRSVSAQGDIVPAVVSVPEPGSLLLSAVALLALSVMRRPGGPRAAPRG